MRKFFYILLAIIGGFITGYLSLTLFVSSGKTETPDLRGKDIVQANQLLKERGLYIRVDGEEYSEMQSGTICRQDPPPQTKVKKGREVGVIVSKGLKFSVLPDVTGMQLEEAEKLLTSKGIPIEKVIYISSKHEEKTVIAQRPEPQEGGKSIRLIVSSGKKEE